LLADHTWLHLDADLRWLEIATDRIRAQPVQPAPTVPITESVPAGEVSS